MASLLLLVSTILALSFCKVSYGPLFWPMPQKVALGNDTFSVDPCAINYRVSTVPTYLREVVDFYLTEAFKCKKALTQPVNSTFPSLKVSLLVVVRNTSLVPPFEGYENFTLTALSDGQWALRADYYPGYLRGFETFSQMFKVTEDNEYYVEGLPLNITDYPEYSWRGVMIDSSRHFLPVDTIKKTIDALLYNKMNVMHWHISDEDSFPLEIASHPELARAGSFPGKTYSKANVLDIVQYALRKGVRVVPQIDSPGHAASWGRSDELKEIVVECDSYIGQLDPTLNKTYEIVEAILREVNSLFIDPVVHFGGDEVDGACWDKRPSIKQWMKANNIASYSALQEYYRKREKTIWRTFSNKTTTFWANEGIDIHTDSDDIIHWWGTSAHTSQLGNRTNKVVLSNYDKTYLDIGYGSRKGGDYGTTIETWRMMYSFDPVVKSTKATIMGGEACLWSQVNNANTHQQKLWPRASAIGERLWNTKVVVGNFAAIADRLSEHARRLRRRGISAMPVTVELCERDASLCFF